MAAYVLECAPPEEAAPQCLYAVEQELTKAVPALLEAMNLNSTEVNVIERQLGESQDRYRELLEQWSSLYEELRAQHGSRIDRVRPYFEASQVLHAASRCVQSAVREFSAAASLHAQAKAELRLIENDLAYGAHKVRLNRDQQDDLSRTTVRVLKCQEDRDSSEQEYAKALRDFQEAQENVEAWRVQIGESTIRRTLPCFRRLQKHQVALASEQSRISSFTERAQHAKSAYQKSLRELDRINHAVHNARRGYEAGQPQRPSTVPEESPEADSKHDQTRLPAASAAADEEEEFVSSDVKVIRDASRTVAGEVPLTSGKVKKQVAPELAPEACSGDSS